MGSSLGPTITNINQQQRRRLRKARKSTQTCAKLSAVPDYMLCQPDCLRGTQCGRVTWLSGLLVNLLFVAVRLSYLNGESLLHVNEL